MSSRSCERGESGIDVHLAVAGRLGGQEQPELRFEQVPPAVGLVERREGQRLVAGEEAERDEFAGELGGMLDAPPARRPGSAARRVTSVTSASCRSRSRSASSSAPSTRSTARAEATSSNAWECPKTSHSSRSPGLPVSLLLAVHVGGAPADQLRHALGQQPALAREVAVEEGGGDAEFPHDGGHVGVLVAALRRTPGWPRRGCGRAAARRSWAARSTAVSLASSRRG